MTRAVQQFDLFVFKHFLPDLKCGCPNIAETDSKDNDRNCPIWLISIIKVVERMKPCEIPAGYYKVSIAAAEILPGVAVCLGS